MTTLQAVNDGGVEQSTGRKALTMHEVAALIGVSYQTVRKLVREKNIRSIQVGTLVRVPAAALDEFLAGAS